MFELVENRLYVYADNSTLLAVIRKPVLRPAVAASLNRDLGKIQEWFNHWYMILNPNKTKALVVSRSSTVNPPHGDLVLSGVSICFCPNLDILWCEVWQQAQVRRPCAWHCLPCLSKNWYFEVGEACFCGYLCVASLLLCICSLSPWVLFSGVRVCCWMLSSASRAPGIFGGQPLPNGQTFFSFCHQHHGAPLCMLNQVNSNSNHCLFSELPSASARVRHTRAAAAAHPLEFEVWRCRTSQFARCFLPAQTRVWNDLPYTSFDTGTLDGFKGAVNRWLLPWVYFSVFRGAGACGVAYAFISNFVVPTWACAAGFNNNNNNYIFLELFQLTVFHQLRNYTTFDFHGIV